MARDGKKIRNEKKQNKKEGYRSCDLARCVFVALVGWWLVLVQ